MDDAQIIDLTKFIINYVNETLNDTVNHLKLQKLLYYVDGWHYVFLGEPLFDEKFEAWMHGPVLRSVWNYYKEHGNRTEWIDIKDEFKTLELCLTDEEMEVIEDVLQHYGKKTAYSLECQTHYEYPWRKAREGYGMADPCTEKIDKDEVKKFFQENYVA